MRSGMRQGEGTSQEVAMLQLSRGRCVAGKSGQQALKMKRMKKVQALSSHQHQYHIRSHRITKVNLKQGNRKQGPLETQDLHAILLKSTHGRSFSTVITPTSSCGR